MGDDSTFARNARQRASYELVAEYFDAAVSGADPIEGRRGFAELLDRVENNGVATVNVEDASRFARELVVQELGIALLAKRGVRLLTASGDDLTDCDDLGRKMMRQVAGAFAEYEKCQAAQRAGAQTQGERQEGRRQEIACGAVARDRCGSEATTPSKCQDGRASQLREISDRL